MSSYIDTDPNVPFIGFEPGGEMVSTLDLMWVPVEGVDGYNIYMAQGKKWEEGDPTESSGSDGEPYTEYYKINANLITESTRNDCEGWEEVWIDEIYQPFHTRLYMTSVKDGVESDPSEIKQYISGDLLDFRTGCPELP